nr:DUF5134 domain-containing protein [Nocardia terpenica]
MLPVWFRLAWFIALIVVAGLHVWHAAALRGQPRWWHGVHTVMAVGMAAMYAADPMKQAGLDRALFAVFTVVAAGLVAVTAAVGLREGAANPLWALTVLDAAAMAYMSAVMLWPQAIGHVVSWVVIAYLCVDAIGWMFGVWDRLAVLRRESIGLAGHDSADVRVSLAVMAASMAYMLAAMM